MTGVPAEPAGVPVVLITSEAGETLRIYDEGMTGEGRRLLAEHFTGQMSGGEWIGAIAVTLGRVEVGMGGYTAAEVAEQITRMVNEYLR